MEQGSEPWIYTFRVYAFNGGIDGEVKLSETQIPTQEKTSFETVYEAKAELRTRELETVGPVFCSTPRPSLMEIYFISNYFQLFMRLRGAIHYENICLLECQHVFLNKNET